MEVCQLQMRHWRRVEGEVWCRGERCFQYLKVWHTKNCSLPFIFTPRNWSFVSDIISPNSPDENRFLDSWDEWRWLDSWRAPLVENSRSATCWPSIWTTGSRSNVFCVDRTVLKLKTILSQENLIWSHRLSTLTSSNLWCLLPFVRCPFDGQWLCWSWWWAVFRQGNNL